jgi:hypothetical protein
MKYDKKINYKRKYRELLGWEETSRLYLLQNPNCVKCLLEGSIIPAIVVDHIRLPEDNFDLFWDESNWQALCREHYDKKTENKKCLNLSYCKKVVKEL